MGRNARVGLFLLMGLVVALARLIEVEVGKAKPAEEPAPAAALIVSRPRPSPAPHQKKTHRASPLEHARSTPAPKATTTPTAPVAKPASSNEDVEWPRGPVYVVKRGETLGVIAQKTLGTSRLAHKLLEANASRIPNPNAMRPGTRLVIPH